MCAPLTGLCTAAAAGRFVSAMDLCDNLSMCVRSLIAWVVAVWVMLSGLPRGAARAETVVDLELVLAVDVSLSMDLEEQRLQRDGYVAAFRDPEVWAAIRSGPTGRIAVTYVEWAGVITQNTIVPWRLIDGPEAARALADDLAAQAITRARFTSISGALQYALGEFGRSRFRGARRVIDVSGDGPNNSGPPVESVRDMTVAQGIVINGLPIQIRYGGPNSLFDLPDLDAYYAACVIGGPGSFSIPIRERSQFASTIRQKLILEIAGLAPKKPARLIRADERTKPEPYDCLIGEKMWRRYMQGGDR